MEYLTNSILGTFSSTAQNATTVIQEFTPRLIEPNIKYVLFSTLQKCHNHRVKIYNWFFNICIFSAFVLIFGGGLYYCYKTKPTPEELRQKMIKDQNYIMSKIRFYQNEKLQERTNNQTSEITNLPMMPTNRLGK